MHLHILESLAKVFCYNVSNADHELRFSNFQHAQISLEEIQEMIHNSFGDLDNDEDDEVEVTDLITKVAQLEREEILLTEISDEEINANKMFYLHLDDLKDENDSESDDDEDSNWDPNDIIADNMAIE